MCNSLRFAIADFQLAKRNGGHEHYEGSSRACEQALRYKPDFELAHNNLQYARKMARALAK
jgi:hypothetical protein